MSDRRKPGSLSSRSIGSPRPLRSMASNSSSSDYSLRVTPPEAPALYNPWSPNAPGTQQQARPRAQSTGQRYPHTAPPGASSFVTAPTMAFPVPQPPQRQPLSHRYPSQPPQPPPRLQSTSERYQRQQNLTPTLMSAPSGRPAHHYSRSDLDGRGPPLQAHLSPYGSTPINGNASVASFASSYNGQPDDENYEDAYDVCHLCSFDMRDSLMKLGLRGRHSSDAHIWFG